MHYTHWQLDHTADFLLGISDWLGLWVCGAICDNNQDGELKTEVKGKDKEWSSRAGVQDWETMSAVIRKGWNMLRREEADSTVLVLFGLYER